MRTASVGVTLYVGQHGTTINGERVLLGGTRCYTAVRVPTYGYTPGMRVLLDSGAFSDPPAKRLSPAGALERQLAWEDTAERKWGVRVMPEAIVSYDRLIDEVWLPAGRVKRRWSEADAVSAVEETVAAAAYLAARRAELAPRALVLSCQGVTAAQYTACAERVLTVAEPGDWLGLGGWCILGRNRSWFPEYRRTLARIFPLAAARGIRRAHLFGVLWEPALAQLLWYGDQCGVEVSTDSTAPLLAVMRYRFNPAKSGARIPEWRANVAWWHAMLAGLRGSRWYGAYDDHAVQAPLFELA